MDTTAQKAVEYAGNLQKYIDMAVQLVIGYTPKFLLAIATLFIGFWVIKIVSAGFGKAMKAQKVEPSLCGFLEHFLTIVLKALVLISVATMLGIQMTSFIAIIGAAGLAVGLALQGSLANFAGGILILLFKPFRVGDFIEVDGNEAQVRKIEIFSTVVRTRDNRVIIIPNAILSNGNIINYTKEKMRRADIPFGIGYNDDIQKARKILLQEAKKSPFVDQKKEVYVGLKELGDNSVNLECRVWCKSTEYWPTVFDMNERIKLAFDKNGITIPFPQRDIHLFQEQKQ